MKQMRVVRSNAANDDARFTHLDIEIGVIRLLRCPAFVILKTKIYSCQCLARHMRGNIASVFLLLFYQVTPRVKGKETQPKPGKVSKRGMIHYVGRGERYRRGKNRW